MIIELFGPPGAGKTTIAMAIAARLGSRGFRVDLRLSARPQDERFAIQAGAKYPLIFARRLLLPFPELLTGLMARERAESASARRMLLSLLHCGMLERLRFHQYLIRLSAAWRHAARSDAIAVFDQGYVQFLNSMLLLAPAIGDGQAAALLESMPSSHLVIQAFAPPDFLESRLGERTKSLGPIGRWLEYSPGTLGKRIEVADRLFRMMEEGGRRPLWIDTHDEYSYEHGLNRAEREILEVLRPAGRAPSGGATPMRRGAQATHGRLARLIKLLPKNKWT